MKRERCAILDVIMTIRIALIHATPLAIEPINSAMGQWPGAEAVNLLDDALSVDRARGGAHLDDAMFIRFERLVRYAESIGAHGVLFTCSAFGPAIERAARATKLPVLKPNEAMFDEAIDASHKTGRLGMVVTFAPSVESMRDEFLETVARRNAISHTARELEVVLAAGAMESMRAGDSSTHDRLITEAAAKLGDCDAIMLAQFSMARALPLVQRRVRVPVLTSPDSAVTRMRAILSR